MSRIIRSIVLVVSAIITTGCVGSTIGSGVGDELFQRPPYYTGRLIRPDTPAIGHLPITYQRGAEQSGMFDPKTDPGSAVDRFVRELNAYLDSLALTTPVRVTGKMDGTAPDVHFGCERGSFDECVESEGGMLNRDGPLMKLAVARPSGSWVKWLAPMLESARVGRVVMITLEVSDYWPRQINVRGSKEVELGTAYNMPVPWLTSLDKPVSVLQLTGALLDGDGKAIRIGAEGLIARPSSLIASAIGAQALISDDDVEKARTTRREDLPGSPLVWQVAVR